jgi:MFS family permease
MIFKKDELKHLWPFYLNVFIYGLSTMIFPFFVLYFINLGFSYFQVSMITSAYAFSMFLFEIPTGVLADGLSRKQSVVLGFLIAAVSAILIPFTANLYLLVFLWASSGIGMTFISGAKEAWVIDNLNKEGKSNLHQEFFIKSSSLACVGIIFAPIIGAILIKIYSIKILWFIFGGGFLLNAIMLMLFTKEHFVAPKLKFIDLLKKSGQNSKIAFRFSMSNEVMLLSILAGIFAELMFLGSTGMQPFLVSLGMAKHQLGYMFSIAAGIGIGASFLSRRFAKYKPQNVMSVVMVISAVLIFSLLFVYPPFFLVAASVFILRDGLLQLGGPLMNMYIHKFIPDNIRATILSIRSMINQLSIALTSLAGGFLLDIFGPQKVLAFGSVFGIFAILMYRKMKEPQVEESPSDEERSKEVVATPEEVESLS